LRQKPILSESRTRFEEVLSLLKRSHAQGELPNHLEKPLNELLARMGG
jgi:hypothetical protein